MDIVISIVGFGNIGKCISGLLLSNIEHRFQINIIDVDWKVYGGILDLEHAAELIPEHDISYNSEELFNKSDFIFHCAGATVPRGKSRLITCQESIRITEAVFENFRPEKEPKIIVVANPVEIISCITQKVTGLPKSHVIGTGTYLDSIRMNHLVKTTNSDITQVNSVLIGEHGTTVFLSEQLSTVNGQSFDSFFGDDTVEELMNSVKAAAEEIKETQKATIYGVSFCAIKILESMWDDQVSTYPASTYLTDELRQSLGNIDTYLSLYCNVSSAGAHPVLEYTPDPSELEMLQKSAGLTTPCIPQNYR